MKSSTATGTTATVSFAAGGRSGGYRGRFAPSPTGLLHLGSLVTALGSYLDARHQQGRWLVRIEDLDTPRVVPGAADQIQLTLENLGLLPDEPPLRQSLRLPAYAEAMAALLAGGHAYACRCTRSDHPGRPYPGTCRDLQLPPEGQPLRLRLPETGLTVPDRLQGALTFDAATLGDPVIRRRDGVYAYQLAVVVDDAAQEITDVVRGADLIDSTGWQVWLQQALALPGVKYAHIPVLTEADGSKLAKSRHSIALDPRTPGAALHDALCLLQQSPPAALRTAPVDELLQWGIGNWRLTPIAGRRQIAVNKLDLGSGARLY
ncbi:MAG TPA: tRNA glutamyl-Q(34) synthetase GluQRS [Steroidobacteraceae bacterium]|nr:tRNA glutamyl-Q(34) synthetase GluQRS [Steroidobacteraceae bacterium]